MKLHPVLLALLTATLPLAAQTYQKAPDKPVDLAHDKNLYVVGYAHLDTQWRWIYPQSMRDYIWNTMAQNFPLFEKYPNYVFNFTGSRRYEFMKEYYPEQYQQVKKYVAAGRWWPAGSSVDEGDTNVPSLESLERHFLYGNHFFQREFGVQSNDYLLPDCFGFPASLPTVLAHGGIKGFSTQKLTWGSAVGIPFNVGSWIGPDGSSILATLNPGGYGNSVTEDFSQSKSWLHRINEDGAKSGVYADYKYFGTGDRGGAGKDSTVEWIEKGVAGAGPVRVISSRGDRIFNDITPEMAAKLPTYKGDLLLVGHSAGSINSQAYMKRWNRKNEQLAAAAEGAATVASWLGAFPYPYEDLYNAWDLVLGSQMHDILPGTSVPKAYEYSWNDEVLALNQFASITERAVAAVLSTMDTSAKGVPVAVYNPLAIDREDPVEADIPSADSGALLAYGPDGSPVPTQVLGRDGKSARVLFIAKVPSAGYAIYDVRPAPAADSGSPLKAAANSIENARYRVSVNAAGDIASIFDKTLNRELLSAPAGLSIHYENPARYPSWNMDWEDRIKPPRTLVGGPAAIRILEDGPARVALEVVRTAENSTFVQDIRLAAGGAGDRVEVLNRIEWRALQGSLRAAFPLTAASPEATFDDKVGVVRRVNDNPKCFEMPQQQWMDLTGTNGGFGVSVLNDSKFGSDKPDDNTLRLTLIYTPGTRGGPPDQGTQDQGRHEILYAIAGHAGDWTAGRTAWQAARLNQPLRAFLPQAHPGPLGRTFSMVSLNNEQVQVCAMKKAEDSDEIVVRLRELAGKPEAGLMLRFPEAISSAREVDGQERPVAAPMGGAKLNAGALAFDMKAFGLRAFALKLASAPAAAAPVASKAVPLSFDTDAVSSRAKRTDGMMDTTGACYAAEMFPARIQREGVEFQLGSTADGAKNALSAHAQRIDLPAGDFNRVHILAAADGDASAQIQVGATDEAFDVPNWTGFVGQWDNRIWADQPTARDDAHVADLKVEHTAPPVGLTPGFIKRTPVAWFATHHNTPTVDAYYQYSYLFQNSYDLPPGAKSITLPDNPKIRVFAVSVSREPTAAPAAAPLYDTLADHKTGGVPLIPQAGQSFADSTPITLLPPLYHLPHTLHYTLDGSEPNAASPIYEAPVFAATTANIAAREIDPEGAPGPVARGVVTIHDTTPPSLVDILARRKENVLDLTFSEPLAPDTVQNKANYTIQPPAPLAKVTQSPDGRGVLLTMAAALDPGTDYTITLHGLRDASPQGNPILPTTRPFNAQNIVYRLPAAALPANAVKLRLLTLPVRRDEAWTMNLYVKADAKPPGRTLIAGFGVDAEGNSKGGATRYFAAFPDGIHFWTIGDMATNSPLDLGRWQMLTASYDGKNLALYKDGQPIGKKRMTLGEDAEPYVSVGPPDPWDQKFRFQGSVQNFTIGRGALSDDQVKKLFAETPKPPQ